MQASLLGKISLWAAILLWKQISICNKSTLAFPEAKVQLLMAETFIFLRRDLLETIILCKHMVMNGPAWVLLKLAGISVDVTKILNNVARD